MNTVIAATARTVPTGSFAAALTIAAMIAAMAGVKTARAFDQQATDAQLSYVLSSAEHRYASGAYASANRHERGFGADGAQRDFQLEGR